MSIERATSITQVDATPVYTPGAKIREGDKEYKYLHYSGSASAAAGTVTYISDASEGCCVNGINGRNAVAGIALGTVAVDNYAWFQTKGISDNDVKKNTDAGISDNALLYGLSTGKCGGFSTTATTVVATKWFGRALEATGSTSTGTAAMLFID